MEKIDELDDITLNDDEKDSILNSVTNSDGSPPPTKRLSSNKESEQLKNIENNFKSQTKFVKLMDPALIKQMKEEPDI